MNTVTIGILAGMGPRSTTPFVELLLDQCQQQYGARYDIDFPHMLIYSLPTPFYTDRVVEEDALRDAILQGILKLQSCGVDFIAIPCNTAHSFIEDIASFTTVPVINMIAETMHHIAPSQRVTVLGTEITMRAGLYSNAITENGSELYFLPEWQTQVNAIITLIKEKADSLLIEEAWSILMKEIKKEQVECVIIACTELSPLASVYNHIDILDSSVMLAKAVVREYVSRTLRHA
jgi:aspartate racemase